MKFLIILIFITSCSSTRAIKEVQPVKVANVEEIKKVEIKALPLSVIVYPGKVSYIEFKSNLDDGKYNLKCSKKKISFSVKKSTAQLFLAESIFQKESPIYVLIMEFLY